MPTARRPSVGPRFIPGKTMARRRTPNPPPIEVKQFSRDEIKSGIAKLRRRIDEIRQLEAEGVRWNDGRKETAQTNLRETVREVFGAQSPEFEDFEYHRIDRGGNFIGGSDAEYNQCFLEGIPYTIELIEGLISRLQEKAADLEIAVPPAVSSPAPTNRRVFIVHGHDEAAKEAVARFLTKLNLEPIILHEQPNAGRTIIEKFERYSDVAYAVVLLTPDDLGASASSPDQPEPRARQNVIFELGFFLGKLGRSHVCALHKGDVEILSDYQGVLFVPMDPREAWKLPLAREIRHAGIDVDLNLIV